MYVNLKRLCSLKSPTPLETASDAIFLPPYV